MSTEVTRSTEKIVPARLAKGEQTCDYQRMATIRGVCGEWIVWVNVEVAGNKAYVLDVPTDGPANFVAGWGYAERDVVTFSADDSEHKNNWRVIDAAIQFATQSASDEILAEYN